jgi:serine/threonine-protein kinase
VLGRYELLLPIASGGMAMVWAARLKGTRGFQKIVAVKTMLPKLSEDDQFEQMFLDEASLASQIRHPHVVEILDLGEQDGVLFLVMEWIDGVPLNQLMKAAKRVGGIPTPVAARIVMQACAGLHAAHELKDASGKLVGLVHRDVSPQNVLVTYEGVTKVVDFGVAKATALNDGLTAAGQIKGKVAYMAPEQVKGAAIDRRVDVFAMGIVLYALTTGKHPFRRESEAATMYNIASPSAVVSPRMIVADYPAELEAVVLRALAKEPDKRYASANDMLRAIDALPPSMRGSTDEDVGDFVRQLLLDRRDERRAALAKALETADQQAEHRLTLRELMHEQRPSSVTTLTPVISGQVPPETTPPGGVRHVSLSGQTNAAVSAITQIGIDPGLKRKRWVLGAIAIAGAVALGAVLLLSTRGERSADAAKPGSAVAAQRREPAATPAPAPSGAAATTDSTGGGALPASERRAPPSADDDSAAAVARPTRVQPAPKASASVGKPTARPAAPPAAGNKPATPSWKHNPGF